MNIFLNIVFGIFYVLWQMIRFFFMGIWKLVLDVLRGVYGKFVALIVGLIFVGLLGGFVSTFHLH
ncbi:hypothetical protein KGM48_02805 [Patescibacteria group bacterium]|nr:hypothetical protein [Patescibacteria group bacterium]